MTLGNLWKFTAGLALLVLPETGAFAISVVVNGQALSGYPPAVERSGRVLLPMREVFESLGATVRWQEATRTATGIQGDTTVRMTIGQRTAYINDSPVTLDVPPQLIGGYTYMPVRFPAEAFGAQVSWDAATQTASIQLPTGLPEAPPPPPPVITPPPPPPVISPPAPSPPPAPVLQPPAPVTGIVTGVSFDRVVLSADSQLEVVPITTSTIVLRQGRQVAINDLRPGDLATVEYDSQGDASVIRASYEIVTGRVLARSQDQIVLDSRSQSFEVQPEVEVVTSSGQAVDYQDIRNGDRIRLRITPDTNRVNGIVIVRQPGVPQETTLRVTANATSRLGPGDVLTVTVTGPAGGQAWFDLGDWRRNILVTEFSDQPGTYRGTFTVPNLARPRREPVIVHLLTADGRTLTAQLPRPIWFGMPSDLAVQLVRPLPGAAVGNSVVIEGYTRPGAEATITIGWTGQTFSFLQQTGRLTGIELTADARGRFRTDPIDLRPDSLLPVRNIRYTATVIASDDQGRQSPPAAVQFTR